MFRYAALLLAPVPLCCPASAEEQAAARPGTHQEFIPALLNLLARTEQCLDSCTDAASVEAALPRLKALANEAHQLSELQKELPEPTVQDYMSAHPHVAEFTRVWEAICGHIERLEAARLVTPELSDVLKLAPKAE